MIAGIIFYIVVFCAESSTRLLVYKNDCGILTVSEPAIDGNRVLLTFISYGTVNEETKVEWKYKSAYTWKISNSSKYILSSRQYIYTMDLYYKKSDKGQYSAELITPAEECSSGWVSLDIRNGVFNVTAKDTVLQAPTGCGILYKGPKRINPGDEVVLKYHQTKRDEYIRQLRVKTDDCAGQLGCPVNEAWYEEESTEYNSMYLYKFRNFSSEMEGNYLIQCTNRSSHNNATNDVKLIIPVPPSSPIFLNTVDIENCTSCILVRSRTAARIQCQVIGGTSPVTVKIAIDGKDEVRCDFGQPFNKTCSASKYVNRGLHLTDIRCEAENVALDQPLTTLTKLYVVKKPWGPYFYNSQQFEGNVDIYCHTRKGRPAPELTMLVNGNIINTTYMYVSKKHRVKYITLTYMERDWNGAKIECCMHYLYFTEPKCSEKTVDYLFSPASVNLTVSKLEPTGRGSFLLTLRCTIINANPACKIKWNHSDEADVTIGTEEITRPAGQGGYTTVSELLLNGSMEINGSKINCQPVCDEFETKDKATHTIRTAYPPTLSINTSGKSSWRVGDAVVLECSVGTYSPVNVTWYNSQNQSLDSFNCGEGAVCLKLDPLQEQDAGTYFCKAATEYYDTAVESVELYIASTATYKPISETREKTLPWTYIGIGAAAAGVVVLIIVTILALKRRRNMDRRKTGHEDIPKNAPNGQAIVNEPRDEQKESDVGEAIIGYENDPKIASRGQAIVNEPRDEQNGTDAYEAIIDYENVPRNAPRGQAIVKEPRDEQIGLNTYEAFIEPSPSDRVYTDLVLPTEGATSEDPGRAFAEPQTEYVSTEFNKVGEQLP